MRERERIEFHFRDVGENTENKREKLREMEFITKQGIFGKRNTICGFRSKRNLFKTIMQTKVFSFVSHCSLIVKMLRELKSYEVNERRMFCENHVL